MCVCVCVRDPYKEPVRRYYIRPRIGAVTRIARNYRMYINSVAIHTRSRKHRVDSDVRRISNLNVSVGSAAIGLYRRCSNIIYNRTRGVDLDRVRRINNRFVTEVRRVFERPGNDSILPYERFKLDGTTGNVRTLLNGRA